MKRFIFISMVFAVMFNVDANEPNTFKAFVGEWTLKGNIFEQIWDGKTLQRVTIPNHHTKCDAINTDKSILCIIDAGELKGHILWSYDSNKKQVHHLSHFGETRNGVGRGALDELGNLTTRVSFQGEPEGSYRIYKYRWISKNEYTMKSVQYSPNGEETGNWYGGTFVRK